MRIHTGRSRHHFGSRLNRRRALSLLAGALFAPAVFNASSLAADPAGRVDDIRGEAFADASNQHRALEKASSLYIGDRVGTGPTSRLTMLLGEDTTIRLGERANLVIDKFLAQTGGEISLESGPMLFERPAGARAVPVRIKSSYGLIAVRGTKFFAGPSNGVFGVFVDQGTVVVSAAGAEVVLQAGQGTNLAGADAKPTAAVAWGAERIRSALDSVR
jgi:ferric-dicitrate binding protein FerR (iron transport regulator)